MDRAHHPLAQKWREEAAVYERDGQPGAAMLRRVANELEEHEENWDNEVLTLDEAAAESGYHKDSLSRMMSEGKVPNAGKPGAPRIRRRDLPRKPRTQPVSQSATAGPQLVQAALSEQGILPAET